MDPLEFWERCLDIIDESDVQTKIGRTTVKYYVTSQLLLVLLEIRPCCLIDGEERKKARDLIMKNFPGIFKIKNTRHSHSKLGSDLVWTTKEPKSPTKKDLKNQKNYHEYLGGVLDYSCPGDLEGAPGSPPWSKRWGISFELVLEDEGTVCQIFGEICINKSHFKPRLREFQRVATLISTSEKKFKVTKIIYLSPLKPNAWISRHFDGWVRTPRKEKFYRIGEGMDREILDTLWELYDYNDRSKWKETEEVEMDISRGEVKRIKETFPNMYLFEKTESGYNISSKLM